MGLESNQYGQDAAGPRHSAMRGQDRSEKQTTDSDQFASRYLSSTRNTASTHDEDQTIRLFQDTLEAFLLKDLPPEVAARVSPAAERLWLMDLLVLTGIPAAAGVAAAHPRSTSRPPELVFDPTDARLLELRDAHRALRLELATAKGSIAAAEIRRCLAVLGAVAAALRTAGLAPAYRAAARNADGRSGACR